MQTEIDHLVVGAGTLEQGVEYIRECLGVDMPFGGVHKKMGTHNHLMQLGNDVFLEIIAVHHEIKAPGRPRWFGLDDSTIRRQIERQPTLLSWVVNTDNLKLLKQKATYSVGEIEVITRGKLSWYFGLPRDGRLLAAGMLPYAIEWHTDTHPSANMQDLGCQFHRLDIYHPYPSWLQSELASIGGANLVEVSALPAGQTPYMKATIHTPNGTRVLSSRHGA